MAKKSKVKKTAKKTTKKTKSKATTKKVKASAKKTTKKAIKKVVKKAKAIKAKGKAKKVAKKIKKAVKAKTVAKKTVAPKKLSTMAKLEKQGNEFIKGAQSAVTKAGETLSEGYSDVKKDIANTTDKVLNTLKENTPAITTAAAIGVGIVASKLVSSKGDEDKAS